MAILYTPNRHIPYPDGDQLPAGNLQLQAIAERLDDDWHKGTNAARLAAPAPSANTAGRRWFETDTGDYYVDIATAWAKVGSVNTVTQANIDASIADHADNYGLGAHIPPTGVTSAMIADGTVGVGDLAFDPATQAELDAEAAARVAADATKQGLNANLTALAGLAGVADRLAYFTGAGALALATLTAAGRNLIDDADASAQLTTLGFSAFIKTLIDDADAPTARATLGSQKAIIRSSSKPVGPADGDLWIYPASAPYCEWLMRYDAAAAQWKYIGGNPIQVGTWNAETRPDNGTWGDTATVLSYTVPFAGSWAIEGVIGLAWPSNYGCELDAAVNPRGIGASGTNGAAVSPTQGGQGAAIPVPLQWWTGFVAGDTIKMQYFASQQGGGGYTATFRYRQMYIKPLYIT